MTRIVAVLLAGGLIAATAFGLWGVQKGLEPVDMLNGVTVEFTIEKGQTAGAVSRSLESAGLVWNARIFSVYARLTGRASKLKTGKFVLSPSMNPDRILSELTGPGRAQGEVVKVTFPEGFDLEQIGARLEESGVTSSLDFQSGMGNLIPKGAPGPEGYAYPDTYEFFKGEKPDSVASKFVGRFREITAGLPAECPNGLDSFQALTLASIVERECKVDSERPMVARVFLNRLKRNMKLESCATVLRVAARGTTLVTNRELAIDSPYNTYMYSGLPPGPICNPGIASLRAVYAPAEGDYLYFVARGDGSHHFSKTLKEHNVHKARLKRTLRSSRKKAKPVEPDAPSGTSVQKRR